VTDWKARAEREAAALIASATGTYPEYTYSQVLALCAVAFMQGASLGYHETLADVEQGYKRMRATL
jgi:hypothetical protein